MRVLLAGGAGYIGSHTAVALLRAGHDVLIIDDLSNSSDEAVTRVEELGGRTVPLLVADLRDWRPVSSFLSNHGPVDAVINFAGLKSVGESVSDPLRYYDVNVGVALSILQLMAEQEISTLVFSSSATVYGEPEVLPLTEDAPTGRSVANPYGRTKYVIEEILRDYAAAHSQMRIVALRYFNPVGAHPSGRIGEDPVGIPNNLMPYVARVAGGVLEEVGVFGTDYDTPDGTGLRDYIHVEDLAAGHAAALTGAPAGFAAYNLGTGRPVSVLELIGAFERASQRPIPYRELPRRTGDVAVSYCDPRKAREELGWIATRSIEDACRDSWNWQLQNPTGYA